MDEFQIFKQNRLANMGHVDLPWWKWLVCINALPFVATLQSCDGRHEGAERSAHLWLRFDSSLTTWLTTFKLSLEHEWLEEREDFPLLEILFDPYRHRPWSLDNEVDILWDWLLSLQKREFESSLAETREEIEELREKYHELLYAVATKHPDETRHETALRYIQEREIGPISCVASQDET